MPDPKYGSELVTRFTNKVMERGKKGVAERIVYDAFKIIESRTGRPPLEVFQQALHNATPVIEVKPRRVGGATYQVPVQIEGPRRLSLAIRWGCSRALAQLPHDAEKLAAELLDAYNNTGATIKRREDTIGWRKPKAFSHYRW